MGEAADEIAESLKAAGVGFTICQDIIEAVKLFDVYKGKPVPADRKSLAFSIRYRSDKGTLTDNEVDALHADIINKLTGRFKTELRN